MPHRHSFQHLWSTSFCHVSLNLDKSLPHSVLQILQFAYVSNGESCQTFKVLHVVEVEKAAKEKDAEAREKRKAYEDVEGRLQPLSKAANDAAAAQKKATQTRFELTKEFESYTKRLEKSEVTLNEVISS